MPTGQIGIPEEQGFALASAAGAALLLSLEPLAERHLKLGVFEGMTIVADPPIRASQGSVQS
jgi:hypothetical protein